MECTAYVNIRVQYFNQLSTNIPNVAIDLIEIMGSKDTNVIFYTANLIQKILSCAIRPENVCSQTLYFLLAFCDDNLHTRST